MENSILQYNISAWSQLTECKSNNSPDLEIKVFSYIQNDDIVGLKVAVMHPVYGTLMAYTIDPKGELVTDITKEESDIMHSSTLLNELKRYGFYVSFTEEAHLSSGQVNLLKTIQGLNYDKLRLCVVYENNNLDDTRWYVTAFNVKENPDWINSNYSPSRIEWETALVQGSAFNVSGLAYASQYRWDWLYNSVMDIDQILANYEDEG